MRGHHRRDRRLFGEDAKRLDLDPIELALRAVHARKGEMRVDRGVTVAREVLCAGQHATSLEPTCPRTCMLRDGGGARRERAVSDDRVLGARMDVGDRREAHRDPERRELARLGLGEALGECGIVEISDATHRGEGEGGRSDPNDPPAFLIDRDERRRVDRRPTRCRMHGSREIEDLAELPGGDIAAEEHNAAAHAGLEPTALVGRELGAREPDCEDLTTENGQLPGHRLWSTTIVRPRSHVVLFGPIQGPASVLALVVVVACSAPPAPPAKPATQAAAPTSAQPAAAATTPPQKHDDAGAPPNDARPTKLLTVKEARRYMLALINRDRTANGLSPVELDEGAPTTAGQAHAEDMVRLGYLGHWGSDGSVPEQRHTEAGGSDMVLENALCFTDEAKRVAHPSPMIDPKQVERAESLFFDEVPPNDGHRKNILKPLHTKVGIGVAQSTETAKELAVPCFAQEFVDAYGAYTALPKTAKVGATIHVEGTLAPNATPTGVGIARAPTPKPIAASELNKRRSYPVPKPYQMYWGPGFITPIVAKITGPKIAIDVPLSDKGQPGLYEVSVWAKIGPSQEQTMVSLRTIVVE